jgi:hypothetical protein
MRKLLLAAAAAALLTGTSGAEAGCFRYGDTGYHWYRHCFGPAFFYPHHRHCYWRHGYRRCFVD